MRTGWWQMVGWWIINKMRMRKISFEIYFSFIKRKKKTKKLERISTNMKQPIIFLCLKVAGDSIRHQYALV